MVVSFYCGITSERTFSTEPASPKDSNSRYPFALTTAARHQYSITGDTSKFV
jgi:hypothetical protein